MKETKRKKLEKSGWKVGSVDEFLDLSQHELEYIELKYALSRNLASLRKSRQMTQQQVADLLRSSQSRVAKMEAGDPSVSLDLLIRSLLALGASKKYISDLFVE